MTNNIAANTVPCVCVTTVTTVRFTREGVNLPQKASLLRLTAHDNEMYDDSEYENDCSMILLMIMKMND